MQIKPFAIRELLYLVGRLDIADVGICKGMLVFPFLR